MNSKHIYYSIISALIIVGLYHLFEVGRYSYPEFKLKAGQVSDIDVIAPFSFPILKSANKIDQEKKTTIAELEKPYRLSDDGLFQAKSRLDEVFLVILSGDSGRDGLSLAQALKNKGIELSAEALGQISPKITAEMVYARFSEALGTIYQRGIYASINTDSILVNQNDKLIKRNKNEFLSLENAQKSFIEIGTQVNAGKFATEISSELVKANLLLDDESLNEMAENATREIPASLGVIQKNEIIIRKNVRVSEEDIDKLTSLQTAIKSRQIRKSPLQQLLVSLGLLLYILIIVLLANKYYIQSGAKTPGYVTDILPMNLGFVLLVFLACMNNYVLGLSNSLIPFAIAGLGATILIGTNFGVFYSMCNLLILSPFINWETYTPAILILITLLTIILTVRYSAFHEYVNIWLYMIFSSIIVNITLGIYKSDPLMTMLTNTGYSVISSTISIIGLGLIIPYYEKKWHFATKQTLLELLDFDHPLLKRLATEAVGTYHHSLIVGNLSERAAEAIGANPLLARVGSYYHDIGKLVNTEIFTENNEDSSSFHDGVKPEESAKLIRGHVLEGIKLAEQFKIPHPVIDIIMQHHGTSHIRYFLELAKKNDADTNPEVFSYPGPRPKSKEAALVMLADIVESTTKAKNIQSDNDLVQIIDQTILRLIREHQFDDSPITMKDLQLAKLSMIPILESIYRKRLDYPDEQISE
ncbi:MAG TPA: HDIG domain-containing protein [Candidatus Cloacimonadota bacterium]|nr:HDIG domain-containing protein [Candidatus Cloacimonadota bacterium]